MIKDIINNKDYYMVEPRVERIEKDNNNNYENSTTKGWLRVQGTNIDMPVIVSTDEKYPLDRENYVWFKNNSEKFYQKINIMGHNIYNLSKTPLMNSEYFKRFEELMSFVYYDFAKENKYIQLTIENEEYLYKIFAVDFITTETVESFDKYYQSKEVLKKELKILNEYSFYKYDVDVNENDYFISLITCTRMQDNKELVVTGRMIRKDEKIKDYKIEKKEKYKEIEEILKGDGSNEEYA